MATLVGASAGRASAIHRPHGRNFLPHVVDLRLEKLSDLLKLMHVVLIIGSQRIEKVTDVVSQAVDHLLQLITTAFQRLTTCLVSKDFVYEEARLRHLRN